MRRVVRLSVEQLQPYLLDGTATVGTKLESSAPAPLSWEAVFGNDNPVEMEVGFGKGLFLLTAAQQCPEANFVGIEIERKYVLLTANRLAKRGLRNARLVCGDARMFLGEQVPPASLQALHVYFPDPWWKTRHRKRRVFTDQFARQCQRALRPGGCLYVVTDVQEYFSAIAELVARETHLTPLQLPETKPPSHDLDYLTNFERKYRREGRPIYRANYRRDFSS